MCQRKQLGLAVATLKAKLVAGTVTMWVHDIGAIVGNAVRAGIRFLRPLRLSPPWHTPAAPVRNGF